MKHVKLGLVGAAGRPTAFLKAIEQSGTASLTAACDLNREAMQKALEGVENVRLFTDYQDFLAKADIDAVIVGTPLPLHVEQSVMALERGLSVYEEIPCGETVEELKRLRRAVKASKGLFMTGENVLFAKEYMQVANMVKAGCFGEILYAEGEYLHDCRELLTKTPWRKRCLFETRGLNYGTHNLGPILRWFPGDRITEVSCVGCGRGSDDPLAGDNVTVMLCRTAKGRLIKIRVDISSPQPYQLHYSLQGTQGAFRAGHWLGVSKDAQMFFAGDKDWSPASEHEKGWLPALWDASDAPDGAHGHGGADAAAMAVFIDALANDKPSPCDIDEGIRMTLPGILSRLSIQKGGVFVPVEDPTDWDKEEACADLSESKAAEGQ